MIRDELADIRPSKRQYEWQKLEFYGFIHFGMNTMTDREWGLGNEDISIFNPYKLNAEQWIQSFKDAQMTGAILTCKHHDGFCLWPSKYTDYTVANTPWKNGKGDIVKEVANACKKYGMKFGIYLSPWDMTETSYGTGKTYDDFYVNQLTELLTNYGDIFCVWLDGANGEGKNGKKQYYDWNRYYEVIRKLQPNAVISICGPDVRWCGNEAGATRKNEWSVVPKELQDVEKIAEKSQKVDDGKFSRIVSSMDEDLGSSVVLKDYHGELVWYPAEVNTSIRRGWFYHQKEDRSVRSAAELFNIYKRSVGGNSTFLLNVPPNKEGLFCTQDCRQLVELGDLIKKIKDPRMLNDSTIYFSTNKTNVEAGQILNLDNDKGYWMPHEYDTNPTIYIHFNQQQILNTFIIKEQITEGQHVEHFKVYAKNMNSDNWDLIFQGEAIGYQKIVEFKDTLVKELKIEFTKFRRYPTISGINVLKM